MIIIIIIIIINTTDNNNHHMNKNKNSDNSIKVIMRLIKLVEHHHLFNIIKTDNNVKYNSIGD